jgi:hypothetical protein
MGRCPYCVREGDIPLDALLFRRRERVATRFDYRHIAGQCTKEDRFESRSLSKLSLATGKVTQRVYQFSNAKAELGQLRRLGQAAFFPCLTLAHVARCAAAILRRAEADMVRFLELQQ